MTESIGVWQGSHDMICHMRDNMGIDVNVTGVHVFIKSDSHDSIIVEIKQHIANDDRLMLVIGQVSKFDNTLQANRTCCISYDPVKDHAIPIIWQDGSESADTVIDAKGNIDITKYALIGMFDIRLQE